MKSPFHSIRWRVQAWHGLILLGAVIAFCFTAYRLAWNNQLQAIDHGLWVSEAKLGAALMRNIPPAPGAGAKEDDNPPFSPAHLVERLRRGAGTLVLLPMPAGPYADEWHTIGHRREVLRSSSPGLRSLVGRDISPELDAMHRFGWSLGASGLAVWLLGLLGGWWIAGRAIQPIAVISRTAAHIADGHLQERISTTGADSELDQLSRVLNHTFDRLQDGMEQQKQFIADASHELRTPVTVLLSETHRILKHDRERTPEEYREVIQTCRDSAHRMRQLIEPLLLLTRQETQGATAPRRPCDFSGILRDTLEQLGPLAAEREIQLHADLQPAACLGDPAALAILATNLLANAIQHNRDGGSVFVRCERHGQSTTLTVRDDGPGIGPADLPHIFERFYRADKARASADGHAGLGLAIARTIVENHGGTITAQSTPGEGAVFTVTLPADGVRPNP
jgi:heavy metal sensor kinase